MSDMVFAATLHPASPARGEVPFSGRGSMLPDTRSHTLPLAGKVGEGVCP